MPKPNETEELELSPLCRTVTRDGVSVDVFIYRGDGEDCGWLLTVIDEERASTVWVDRFSTDQAALDEVMRTIEIEGMSTFLRPAPQHLH